MRLLFCETWQHHWYGKVLCDRLQALGADVFPFEEGAFVLRAHSNPIKQVIRRVEYRYRIGESVRQLNHALLRQAIEQNVDAAIMVRGDVVYPNTLRKLRQLGIRIIGINNDNPFSPDWPWHVWRHLRRGIRYYDSYFVYRAENVEHVKSFGCPSVEVLRSYYVRERNFPILNAQHNKSCDVLFIGHWEDDDRDDYIAAMLNQPNIRLRIYGTYWQRSRQYARIRAIQSEITPLYDPDYNIAINNAKIALVFLSKRNRDTYTRRCFEITAARTFMLSQYTDDLASLFEPETEAVYFRTPQEMTQKIEHFLKHESDREQIAAAGFNRVMADGHEAGDRAKQLLMSIERVLDGTTINVCSRPIVPNQASILAG